MSGASLSVVSLRLSSKPLLEQLRLASLVSALLVLVFNSVVRHPEDELEAATGSANRSQSSTGEIVYIHR